MKNRHSDIKSAENKLYFVMQTPIDDNRPVYLSGNFNNWAVGDESYKMFKTGPGEYSFCFDYPAKLNFPIQYNYTKGNWNNVELDEAGDLTKNRITSRQKGIKRDNVPHWMKEGKTYQVGLLPEVHLIDKAFYMPQLDKHRRIYALLPSGYWSSTQRYPVIYMQDAQNLFDEKAPFGTWGIDKKMAIMKERGLGDFIVIAVEHGGSDRISEFSPYKNFSLGSGDGKKYVQFLEQTLKPYIDHNYRTLPDRSNTAIGGSSMGGLISVYAGLMFPYTFGRLMVFSPSLWVSPKIYFDAIEFHKALPTKIYLYAGGAESRSMIPNIRKFQEIFKSRGLDTDNIQFNLSLNSKGKHNEYHWGREFSKAIEWLFF